MRTEEFPFARTALAWLVHLYTASGAVLGFLALEAAFAHDYALVFRLLAAALAIDASDGVLARAVEVKRVVPWFDGALLDNLVDYLNYVVVPVAVFVQPGVLPEGTDYLASAVLLASAYGFSRTDAKGFVEHYFLGFPSYWNIIAFYFVVLGSPASFNLAVVLAGIILVFVPMRWIYPTRSDVLRKSTISLGLVWALMALWMLVRLPEPSPVLGLLSLFYPLYYTGCSLFYHFRY